MPTYIILGNFTDQGIRNVRDTTKRAEALREMGRKSGVTVKEVYWTLGQYDILTILEAPNDEAVTALGLSVGALGNVRTQTLRAFSADEMGRLIGKLTSTSS
jgi:uncharacterized protein with GYD domain